MTKEVCVGKEESVFEGWEGPKAATEKWSGSGRRKQRNHGAAVCLLQDGEGGEAAAFWENRAAQDSVGRLVLTLNKL